MKCEHCGNEIAEKPSRDPWCMYQMTEKGVISNLFDPLYIPEGWYDSPRAAEEAVKPSKIDGRTKEGRQQKALLNDDSTGTDQQLG